MAKQREATGLHNRGKWRLLSGNADIFILHEIRPFEAENSSYWWIKNEERACKGGVSYMWMCCGVQTKKALRSDYWTSRASATSLLNTTAKYRHWPGCWLTVRPLMSVLWALTVQWLCSQCGVEGFNHQWVTQTHSQLLHFSACLKYTIMKHKLGKQLDRIRDVEVL